MQTGRVATGGMSDRPVVVMACGLPASGKTTASARLHGAAGGVLVRSCDVFQDLAISVPEWVKRTDGLARDVEAFHEVRHEAHEEIARRVERALAGGARLVIVDAIHAERVTRLAMYRVCEAHGAAPVLLWCRCDDLGEIRRRFARRRGREHEPEHEASDLAVYRYIVALWDDPAADRLPGGGPVPIVVHDTLGDRLTLPAGPDLPVLRLIRDTLAPPEPAGAVTPA